MKSYLYLAISALLFSPAVSFVIPQSLPQSMSLNLNPDQMAGKSVEVGGGVWDPLGLADLGSEKTLRWFRASEVKHCRVAMLATIGWAFSCNGWGKIEYHVGDSLKALPKDPWAALEQTPKLGLVQIMIAAGIIEVLTETGALGTHYMKVEDGYMNPLMRGEVSEKLKNKELKNGRLAMIGIFSFFLGNAIPGSVPLYPPEWLF